MSSGITTVNIIRYEYATLIHAEELCQHQSNRRVEAFLPIHLSSSLKNHARNVKQKKKKIRGGLPYVGMKGGESFWATIFESVRRPLSYREAPFKMKKSGICQS